MDMNTFYFVLTRRELEKKPDIHQYNNVHYIMISLR